ncbi:MAG: DUF302 domain-containing protein [Ardenticatenaceae bacterium]|nr:DUF302 domain-containing protein [Ardenticatenaceae bacterium]
MTQYGMGTLFSIPFDQAIDAVTAALKEEGFGVLTEIDVRATLKQKLDVNFRNYRILGACNPPLAYQALQDELKIGLLMPCNVIFYEADDGRTAIMIADPLAMVNITANPGLTEMAEVARAKLFRVLKSLSQVEYNLNGMLKR